MKCKKEEENYLINAKKKKKLPQFPLKAPQSEHMTAH